MLTARELRLRKGFAAHAKLQSVCHARRSFSGANSNCLAAACAGRSRIERTINPALAARTSELIQTQSYCLALPLLHDMDRADWRLWFEAHGVALRRDLKGPSFSDDHLMVQAAVAGQGLALVRDVYVDSELRAGTLVRAIDVKWPTRFAYYAVSTPGALQRPAVRHFRAWLIAEAGKVEPFAPLE